MQTIICPISEESSEESENTSEEVSEEVSEKMMEETKQEIETIQSDEQELDGFTFLDDDIAHGTYENVIWVIDKVGKLTISGTGEFAAISNRCDCEESEQVNILDWAKYSEQVLSAEVNLSGCKDASFLFKDMTNLVSVNLCNFDTSNVTNMEDMFCGCESLKEIDLSGFKTSKVTNMKKSFADVNLLKN